LKTCLYAQAAKDNIENILKIKNAFPRLFSSKILKIHNVTNNNRKKSKPKLNMTTKEPSRKQVIIPISKNNSNIIVSQANVHISNINRLLKDMKSEVLANFICSNNKGVIIITNKVVATSDLNIVEKYIKELNNINSNNIMSPQLPQSKSYLKILGISYYSVNTNSLIISDAVEEVIKDTYIFNNVVIMFHPHIIKASPKSDIAVIWVDIWNSQNSTKAML